RTSASGPFSTSFVPGGGIESYASGTAIAINSGDFTAAGTFLGGFAPSADICSGGCGIEVISGVTLSTAGLNGALNFDITSITVATGATFQLGTPGASTGFKVSSAVTLSISGHMSFVGSGGYIRLPPGSDFNITAGGAFSSAISVSIEIFDLLTGLAIGPLQTLGTLISGGTFTLSVSASGSATTAGTGSGSVTFLATKSGELTDATVWSGGLAPSGNFSLSIPAGITVTISGGTLSLQMLRCDVYGTLALGSGSATFTFAFPPTIIVRSSGKLLDQTSSNVFLFPSNSIIAVLSGGGFGAKGTALKIVQGGVAGA
ncbi:unnamed protein product, partial [Rotaria sp. Silwood1]